MLSETKVKAAKPRPKPYKLSDGGSLFLLVTPSGGKLWRWNYLYDGKQKSMAFGAWPHVSIGDARSKRDEAYSVLAEGRDPSIVKRLKIEAIIEASRQTFERVAREWHANAKPQWAAIHAADVIRSLERDVFPYRLGRICRLADLDATVRSSASCARSRRAVRSKPQSVSGSGFLPRLSSVSRKASARRIQPKSSVQC